MTRRLNIFNKCMKFLQERDIIKALPMMQLCKLSQNLVIGSEDREQKNKKIIGFFSNIGPDF